ncbi:MAG: flagellar motor switch protein FliG [Pirellulaceae bacterium]|nr:flagellar motor switch protein FliG [Pirellulaceae bacterium]
MSGITSLRKAAVLLTSLPEDAAAALLGKLTEKQVEHVSIEIAKLGRLGSDEQEAVIYEFADANPNALGGDSGGIDAAKSLLEKALGKDHAGSTLESVEQSIAALPFGFLKDVDPQNLLTFIVDEHPQTIAVILTHLPPSYGAEVMGGLSPERQLSVIQRIANMGQTNPEVVDEVERGLEKRMASVMSQSYESAGGVSNVAEILNVTDRATERSLLDNLSQEDPDLVEEIRRLMFVFEDIQKITDKDVQAILKNVENSQWAMAMKGASEELKQKILTNMSKRAAEMLTEEIEFLGAVKVSDVESMQQQIVDIARRLEDTGEVTLSSSDDDSEQMVN